MVKIGERVSINVKDNHPYKKFNGLKGLVINKNSELYHVFVLREYELADTLSEHVFAFKSEELNIL